MMAQKFIQSDNVMILKKELTNLHQWASIWMMTFNIDKYSVLCVGRNNPVSNYTSNNKVLSHSNCERDLDVAPILTSNINYFIITGNPTYDSKMNGINCLDK